MSQPEDRPSGLERAIEAAGSARYALRLYVCGMTPRSLRAVAAVRRLCEGHLKGRYEFEVIDLYQSAERARSDELLVAPTLVKHLPPPLRRLTGDLSDEEAVLKGLGIIPTR
jgi:circadian clock protein KaiB